MGRKITSLCRIFAISIPFNYVKIDFQTQISPLRYLTIDRLAPNSEKITLISDNIAHTPRRRPFRRQNIKTRYA